MGGKVWSDLEEEIYWSDIAPRAPPGLQGQSKAGRMKSWKPLVKRMEYRMRKKRPGQELPRKYTEVSLYEHGFQNLVQGKHSPNAKQHVEKYKALLEKKAENPESGSDNAETESLEPSVREYSESEESGPSGPSGSVVAVPMSAISQQSTTPQVPMCQDLNALAMAGDASAIDARPFQGQQELTIRGDNPNDLINSVHGSQERPGKRARTMENYSHDTDWAVGVFFPNQNDMPVQQNANAVVQFPQDHPACGGFPGYNNMGAAYPGPVTGYHGAQNNANSFFDHNGAQIKYRGAAGPGLFFQNNTNLFMGHEPAQTNHGFVTSVGGVQKRKCADMWV